METIDDVKRRISRKYLGKLGVHGVGVSRTDNAITLHVSRDTEIERLSVLGAIEQEAHPFGIILVREEAPSIM